MSDGPPRVLVVDDSVVVRSTVTKLIEETGDFEVVGAAANGSIALKLAESRRPDIVILDVEMPGMDGLELLGEIETRYPDAVVIMFSHLTEAGASVTFEALERGAADYVTKPVGFTNREAAFEHVREQLIPRLRALSGLDEPQWPAKVASRAGRPRPIELVVVAASTGGPPALTVLLQGLPESLSVPLLIVQHMPPVFTEQLAARLDRETRISVRHAVDGDMLTPGVAYVAPGGRHVLIGGQPGDARLITYEGERLHGVMPAADVSLSSAVQVFGGGVMAVVLTGMGHDALAGSVGVFEAGGVVLAQDEASAVVWGMPGAVASAGVTQAVVPLSAMAGELVRALAARSKVAAP